MRKLLSIALLLLYVGITLAAAPVIRDTTLLPITILLPITTLLPAPHTPVAPPARRIHIPSPPSAPPAHITLRLSNPSPTLPITHIALEWELQVNGTSRQKGMTTSLTIPPGHPILVRLPARWPGNDSNEVFLQLRYRQVTPPSQPQGPQGSHRTPATLDHSAAAISQSGPVLAEEQLLVQAPANTLEVRQDGELTFTDVNDTFTIQSPLVHIEFNKQTGWLQRYEANGAVLLMDTPVLKTNFWRVFNRLPSGAEAFGGGADTATAWQEASHDPHLQLFSTSTGSTMIIVRAEYTVPATSCLLHVSYTINAKGEILIGQQLEADSTQKGWPLPCFGMRWLLPATNDSIEYYGLGRMSDSTGPGDAQSPDTATSDATGDAAQLRDSIRLHAPWVGIYHETVGQQPASPASHQRNKAMVTDVITAIRWIRISGPGGGGLLITADSTLFNASARHATSSVLLNIDSRQPATTGIPGDTHQLSYGLPYGNYRFTYKISPFNTPQKFAKRI